MKEKFQYYENLKPCILTTLMIFYCDKKAIIKQE